MNILLLYSASETFTSTVHEHLSCFGRWSAHRWFYAHHGYGLPLDVDLQRFDAVGIHYCLRLPYDQVSEAARRRLAAYPGLKFVFLQDEYENTHRTWHWIRELGIRLVFTVVPPASIERVYPPREFPGVRFVSVLTGYVPEQAAPASELAPPSARRILVGYRGRPLPLLQYGQLAHEKTRIGQMVRAYCEQRGLPHDVDWREEARIYGGDWYAFLASCRTMLGTESGSNVFDWDGDLASQVAEYRAQHRDASEDAVYQAVVAPRELPGLMNQVSPRVFEAISVRTVLILFEGEYSGVVEPWQHYLPLRKDGSNLDEVFAKLRDGAFVDAMAQRAWDDVIGSGRYAYAAFAQRVDGELASAVARLPAASAAAGDLQHDGAATALTTRPLRAAPVAGWKRQLLAAWHRLPPGPRGVLRAVRRKLLP